MAYSTYTESDLQTLFDFYGNKCLICGSPDRLTIDHVNPTVLGGLDVLENIQPLCHSCNSRKNARFADYRPVRYPHVTTIVEIPAPVPKSIFFNLKAVAESKGLNPHQISMCTGVSYPTVLKLWSGNHNFTALSKLCDLLDVDPGDLLKRISPKTLPYTDNDT